MPRVLLIAIVLATASLPAQERQVTASLIEVVSVKENKSGGRIVAAARSGAPGRFGAINMTLRLLINAAYGGIPTSRIFGGPDWTDTVRFDVEGIGDPARSDSDLLQVALRDRFALRVRRESRQFDVYALVRARRDGRLGPGLRTNSDCTDEARKKLLRVRPGKPACGTIDLLPSAGKAAEGEGYSASPVGRLSRFWPSLRVHHTGNSFGARSWLACLRRETDDTSLKSLVSPE